MVDGRVEASADVVPLGVHVELVGNFDAEVLVLAVNAVDVNVLVLFTYSMHVHATQEIIK